jgi:DMSO/TMAO reductase YedYZ heme-binding membrane subunit
MIAAQTTAVPVAWLVARAAGLVAFGLMTLSVVLGLSLSTKLLGGRRGKMLLGWHQTLMWTAFGMVVVHGTAVALDPTLQFGVVGVLIPGAAHWRPVPVAAGIITAWLLLLLATSFNVRRRIGQRRWRLLHYASFGAFGIGLYHALNTGTDLAGTKGLIFAGVCLAPVLWLVYARILMPRARPKAPVVRPAPPRATDRAEVASRPDRVQVPA